VRYTNFMKNQKRITKFAKLSKKKRKMT